jgi:hypothetical protein
MFISFAANLGQWELVEAAISSVDHLYPEAAGFRSAGTAR